MHTFIAKFFLENFHSLSPYEAKFVCVDTTFTHEPTMIVGMIAGTVAGMIPCMIVWSPVRYPLWSVSMIAAHAIALEFVLADRVAVIRQGRLKALKSNFYGKSHFAGIHRHNRLDHYRV